MKYFLLTILVLLSNLSFAYSTDTGIVTRIYTSPNGAIAFQIEGGFVNAEGAGQCENNNGWAGITQSDPVLKSLILAAKVSKSIVKVDLEGCNGSWFNIVGIYLN